MPLPEDAPRRSSRRPKTKQYSTYKIGDVVEISRNNVETQGRLVYKLSEGPTPNPRWLVTFDRQSWKDEELYERSFGKVMKADKAELAPKTSNARKGLRGRGNNNNKTSNQQKSSNSNKSSGSSGEDDESGSKKKKKAVAFSEGSVAGSEDSSPPSNSGDGAADSKVSAREQRSLRRQAVVQDEVLDSGLEDGKKRGRPGSSIGQNGNNNHRSNKRARKDEEVVKIPMLTGTLYLYRGLYRRAEFVRRY